MAGSTEGHAPGAGWFPDPAGSPLLRWWDGAAWTAHFIDPATGAPPQEVRPEPVRPEPILPQPGQFQQPATPVQADRPLTRRELRERELAAGDQHGEQSVIREPIWSSSESEPIQQGAPVARQPPAQQPVAQQPVEQQPVEQSFAALLAARQAAESTPGPSDPFTATAADPSVPAATEPPAAADAAEEWPWATAPQRGDAEEEEEEYLGGSSTVAVWLFAVLPILHVALIWYVYEQLQPAHLTLLRWPLIAGPIVIYLVLAAIDRGSLKRRGYERSAFFLFAIVPPLYLIIRAARVGAAGAAPLIIWLVLQAAAVGALIVVFPIVFEQLTAPL